MTQANAASEISLGRFTQYNPSTGFYSSRHAPPRVPADTVYQFCLGNVSFDDATVAMTEVNTGRFITYGELKLKAQRFGLGLVTTAKLKPGDTILVALHSSIDFAISVLAAQFVGIRVALANPDYAPKELKHVYRLVKPKKAIVHSSFIVRAVKANMASFNLIVTNTRVGRGGMLYLDDLLADVEAAKAAKPYIPDDLNTTAYLPASSGTTGLPKAVQISHKNLVSMISINFATPEFVPESLKNEPIRMLSFLPFFHAYGLVGQLLLVLRQHGHLFILRPFTPESFCKALETHRPNVLNCVPPVLTKLTKYPGTTREAFASVKRIRCGAAPLDAETQAKFSAMTGVPVVQGWGMTELTLGGLDASVGHQTPGSVGCLVPSTLAKVVDVDTGKPVAPGERGELQIKGDQVFSGYFANPQETKASFTADGFFRTGDVAIVDAKTGEFSIVDRLKELIKYQGFQVAPAELEGVLISHPKVGVAAVVGRYDKAKSTELPCAFIELTPAAQNENKQTVAEEIDQHVRSKVSHHKFLRGGVHIIDKVPVSPSGKILRKQVRSLAQALDHNPQAKL